MMFTPDEARAIVAALGSAAQDGEQHAKIATAGGDTKEAALAGYFAEECKRLSRRFALARGSFSFLTVQDSEIITAALRTRANFWQQQSLAASTPHEKNKRGAFAGAFAMLADRIEREVGRSPALKH